MNSPCVATIWSIVTGSSLDKKPLSDLLSSGAVANYLDYGELEKALLNELSTKGIIPEISEW